MYVCISDHRGLFFAVLFMTNINDTQVNNQLELLITSEHTHYSVVIQTAQDTKSEDLFRESVNINDEEENANQM
jgi:hypothetical protein